MEEARDEFTSTNELGNVKERNNMRRDLIRLAAAIGVVGAVALVGATAHAATTATSKLEQVINVGTLSTDIRSSSDAVINTPTFAMGAVNVSTTAQTSTGTFGENEKRITVDNPGGANNGWTLTLNATTPGTGKWEDGAKSYSYNGTAATGQLTVNPAAGTLSSVVGASTGITLGAQTAFTGTAPVTLINAAANSDDVWRGYVTGVGLSQSIPAAQAAGTYTLPMTQTVTAI